ncbi:MAG: type II toxin-antitoxin system VapC family toxin [Actinobacteria bacterium]|nr:type II toxin-antitoxin system VapC family toxin [Actinomycetota bacterium]
MIVDTSALVAIVLEESGHDRLFDLITNDALPAAVGAPTLVELGIVLSARLGRDARPLADDLLRTLGILEIAFGEYHWREAVRAFNRFGRGRHRAALNMGDCMTYAVARLANEPLLFVGDDFTHTDLASA